MKKTTFYKVGALGLALLGAGVFTSFDNALTDEQKIEAAYNQLVIDFKTEQTAICKTEALALAQAEWSKIQSAQATNRGEEAPTYSGGSNPSKPSRNYSGGSSPSYSGSEEPVTSTPSTGGNTGTTSKPVDAQKQRNGAGVINKEGQTTEEKAASQKRRNGAGVINKEGQTIEEKAASQKRRNG